MVGLGNIYVDEALFRAGIHPERKANHFRIKEIAIFIKKIAATLSEAVKKGGSTIRSYVNSQGQIGMFQLGVICIWPKRRRCVKCGTTIEKRVLAAEVHIIAQNAKRKLKEI